MKTKLIKASSLEKLHTFGLPVYANHIIFAADVQQLVAAWQEAKALHNPFLLLGEGSNVLFLDNFAGTVVFNRMMGITFTENELDWHLHVGAGENWHQLVRYSLEQGMYGLENLALIPGCVGAAPIQNIGAYGVELKEVCEYVDVLNMQTGAIRRFGTEECQFGYRESIFKHQYRDGHAIVAVGFKLAKEWQPVLEYGDLKRLDRLKVTPLEVFEAVCTMRRAKMPDPAVTGSAGSFFKNPLVAANKAELILVTFPAAPNYLQKNGTVKLAAGWLIDQCHLKGYSIGGAAVHQQQALVLINQHHASVQDVVSLAQYVRQQVGERFDVWLEPEVRFIASNGECDAVEALS